MFFLRAISPFKRLIHLHPSHPSSEISVKVSVAILAKFPGISPKFPSHPGSKKIFVSLWTLARPDVRSSRANEAAYRAIEGADVPTIKGAELPMSEQVGTSRPPRRSMVSKVKMMVAAANSEWSRSKVVANNTSPESGLRSEETGKKASSAPVLPRWCPFQ